MSNIEKKIYIHHNFNKNQIKQVLLENSDYKNIPTPNIGEDKGLIYYDTLLDRVLVWNGNVWKLVKYLDDRDYVDFSDVLVEDIWVESNLIPGTYASASVSPIVEFTTNTSPTYIPSSYSYKFITTLGERTRIVPERYGSFYSAVVKTQAGTTCSTSSYAIQGDTVTFINGFPFYSPTDLIDDINPPVVEYWKYTGRVGSFNFVGGVTNIMEVTGVVSPSISVPSFVRADNIISVTINGILIYKYSYNSISSTVDIDTVSLGYSIDIDDFIRIELNV